MSTTQPQAKKTETKPTDKKETTQQQGQQQRPENKSKIQVSSTKKPLNFYVYLTKKFLQDEETVELSGLGNAINTVVSCGEILKSSGAAVIKKIETSSVQIQSTKQNNRTVLKAKIQIFVSKSKDYDTIMAKERQEQLKRQEEKKKKEESANK